MNYDESIRDHLAEVERTLDDVRNTLDTPYLKIGRYYIPVYGNVRYTNRGGGSIYVHMAAEHVGVFEDERAEKLVKWLDAHSVDIEAQ